MSSPTPDRIMQLGLGFWGSKTLLSAIELRLFTLLAAKGAMSGEAIRGALGLHPRSVRDFLDALVALGMLGRTDPAGAATSTPDSVYANTAETAAFLDRSKPSYMGGILEMAGTRLYPFWGSLTEGLRTGLPQNEAKSGGDLFGTLYAEPSRLKEFLAAMTGLSVGAGRAIAQQFPWKDYRTFMDVGGAQGAVPVQVALAHPHLTGGNFDLPVVGPIFEEYAGSFGLSSRLRFHAGDFFKDPIPRADVLIMGHILHDWSLDQKRMLLRKCYDALPTGGSLIVFEALIDDARRSNAFGLLMSLNMLIETPGGFDYSGADGAGWMREAGFRSTRVEHLVGPDSMLVGVK